jgi:hypothetical protein
MDRSWIVQSYGCGDPQTHERRETRSSTGSEKVEASAVFGGNDHQIGSVQRVMIYKLSALRCYVVGDIANPVPWPVGKLPAVPAALG